MLEKLFLEVLPHIDEPYPDGFDEELFNDDEVFT